MNTYLEEAIRDLRISAEKYQKAERYYAGRHDLAFATEKFENTFGKLFREFALNLCPVICDAVRDKLKVKGFSLDEADGASNDAAETAARIWRRNRMRTRAGEVHKEALKCGDAYMIVWPDDAGRAQMIPNRAGAVVTSSDESENSITRAAKTWRTPDKYVRVNLFFPDRVERYVSRKPVESGFADAADMKLLDGADGVVANPFGSVPVFRFANNADLAGVSRSELEDAIPVQDGLNKSVLDMLVAMEYSAFRQRWAAGIEYDIGPGGAVIAPFKPGIDQLWLASNPDARFGDFDAARLEEFLKVKDSFRIDMASVTGTPLHYFLQNNAGLPSGEALKKSETRFIAKVRERQENFGQVWADAMSFAIRIETGSQPGLLTEWEDPSPLLEREFLENILLKRRIGLPVEQALIEAGYGRADVEAMEAASAKREL
jgi:hypothetical protein